MNIGGVTVQLIPLIVLTLVVRSSCLALFDRPLQMQSVRAATDLDSRDQQVRASFTRHCSPLPGLPPVTAEPAFILWLILLTRISVNLCANCMLYFACITCRILGHGHFAAGMTLH